MVNTNSDPIARSGNDIRKMVFASLFAALTAVGAYISIPIGPVPLTLQVLFVILAGALLGSRWGFLSMIVYVLLGIVGLPVFSGGGSGIGYLLGPTGGYVVGFVLSALIMGLVFERKHSEDLLLDSLILVSGVLIIYTVGLMRLIQVADLTLMQALALGMLPFLPGDMLKVFAAAYIINNYRDRI